MKRKLLVLLMVVLVMSCTITMTACNRITTYYPDLPLDLEFNGTLTYELEVDRPENQVDKIITTFAVAQKYETVAGERRFVTYVEWRQKISGTSTGDNSRTYLHISDKTFRFEDSAWVEAPTTGYYNYDEVYVNLAKSSDSYRALMVNKLFGRQLNNKYKTETTNAYIKYVGHDGEMFMISNDKYNVILAYEFDTHLGSRQRQTATFKVGSTAVPHLKSDGSTGAPDTDYVPNLDQITPAMLNG